MKSTRLRWTAGLIAIVLLGLSGCSSPTNADSKVVIKHMPVKQPNIVFVLTDDLSWDLVRFMPHVQQMEREGSTFKDFFVTDSLCCPSRSSIFTGRLPHDTGIYGNDAPDGGYTEFHARDEETTTFAAALRRAGYNTAMMGKYLNGYQPADGVESGWTQWDVAGNGYPELNYGLNENGKLVHYGNKPQDYLTQVLGGLGSSFIDKSAAEHKPFMMEVATFAPHAPYVPAPQDRDKFPGLKAPRDPAFDAVSTSPEWLRERRPLTPANISTIDTIYRKRARTVQAVDRMIGTLEAEVRAKGLSGDTYFFFSSDNGFHTGQHRLGPGKMTAFDTDINVPMMVTGPGVPAGHTVTDLSENIDFAPTFERMAGAPVPAATDGRSLLNLLLGGTASRRDAVLVEHHGPLLDTADPDYQGPYGGDPPSYEAIRMKDSVYVEYVDGEREYYDIAKDPYELHDIYPQLSKAKIAKLHAALRAMENCHGQKSCTKAAIIK